MEFTGERFVPELEGNIALEHLHRYAVACEIAKGMQVLDIACGEGYGSAMLAQVAHCVTGVDISKDVIDHASLKYRTHNLEFKVGSCSAIPLETATVDVVVSFETIEHCDQHEVMMSEIQRVLRPKGVLIISSPDKHEYSVVPSYTNPFHVKELYREEFEGLIRSRFKHVDIFGQRIIFGSAILGENMTEDLFTFSQQHGGVKVTKGIARPLYFIAVASDGAVPTIASGIFERPIGDGEAFAGSSKQIGNLHQSIADLKVQLTDYRERTHRVESELQESRLTLEAIRSSATWRAGAKLKSLIEPVLPVGSRRRAYARKLLSRLIND